MIVNRIRQELGMSSIAPSMWNMDNLHYENNIYGHDAECVHHEQGRVECHMKGWKMFLIS